MDSPVAVLSNLRPRLRRIVIMLMDVVMVMMSVPLSLLLSNSFLSFNPLSWYGMLGWFSLGVAGHLFFRFSGLYRMMWRFASTPDFYSIIRNCAVLTIGLYFVTLVIRTVHPITGLNEREFIIFFFVTFTFISAPRLFYRYLREGAGWVHGDSRAGGKDGKRGLFLGSLDEADVIISYTRANLRETTRIIGIMTNDREAIVGTNIQGVPIVSEAYRAPQSLDEYFKDTDGVDVVIFGHGAEKTFPYFPELVRIARRGGASVEQFSGLSHLRRSGKLTLEKVEMETILRRSTVSADHERLAAFLKGKRVLVTGGAGSIGRVLVKRALGLGAEAVLVADISEFNIFSLQRDHIAAENLPRVTLRILDVGDKRQFSAVVNEFHPDIIFHAAALKHVPLLEENWESAIKTNVFGTLNCVEAAVECAVPQFVLISSDKAADPTSILGLTKSIAEQITNGMHFELSGASVAGQRRTNLIAVRFGNVFGSDGSVSTIFQSQIDSGGPVTITDPSMTRYLMTIGEAVDLVIMSAAVSASERYDSSHGIYMLDMGDPVSILTVAETMIRLAGKKPRQDIEIVVTGKRPGEKLHESLCAPGEEMIDVDAPSIFGLRTPAAGWAEIQAMLRLLGAALQNGDRQAARTIMKAFCDPGGRRLRPLEDAAVFAAPDRANSSPAHDFAPLLEGVSNGHADLAKVSNGGNPVRLGEEVRNGAAKPAAEVDGIGLPAAAQWQDRPPRSEPALDEPDTAVVRLHSERGAARRH
jgi:O-antigen biosynthesis protein WbqV